MTTVRKTVLGTLAAAVAVLATAAVAVGQPSVGGKNITLMVGVKGDPRESSDAERGESALAIGGDDHFVRPPPEQSGSH